MQARCAQASDDEAPDVSVGHWGWSKRGMVVRGPELGTSIPPAGPDKSLRGNVGSMCRLEGSCQYPSRRLPARSRERGTVALSRWLGLEGGGSLDHTDRATRGPWPTAGHPSLTGSEASYAAALAKSRARRARAKPERRHPNCVEVHLRYRGAASRVHHVRHDHGVPLRARGLRCPGAPLAAPCP